VYFPGIETSKKIREKCLSSIILSPLRVTFLCGYNRRSGRKPLKGNGSMPRIRGFRVLVEPPAKDAKDQTTGDEKDFIVSIPKRLCPLPKEAGQWTII
jgi:hypothetical protein